MIRLLPIALMFTAAALAQSGERRFDVSRFDAVELASSDAISVVAGTVLGQSLRASRAAPAWALRHD